MARIIGEVESLTTLKQKLKAANVQRFSSVGQIRAFLRDCEAEKAECRVQAEVAILQEKRDLRVEIDELAQEILDEEAAIRKKAADTLLSLQGSLDQLLSQQPKGIIVRYRHRRKVRSLERQISKVQETAEQSVVKEVRLLRKAKSKRESRYSYLAENYVAAVEEKYRPLVREIEHTKSVLAGLSTTIAGAIGEKAVEAQLQKLPQNFYVINNFSHTFQPPIYRKATAERIVSIQADHLVVGPPGVFLIETKNWSQQSVERLDLRSPVDQILRSSFALYVLLNSQKGSGMNLASHHWGNKKVPVKNVIAMTNARPRAEFNHVKVVSLEQLNGYIQYFDAVLTDAEVERLVNSLSQGSAKAMLPDSPW